MATGRKRLRRTGMITAAGLAVTAFGGVAVAASAPQAATAPKLFACYSEKTNELFHATRSTCPTGDRSVSWNARGPQGVQGPQGARGAQGSQGIQGGQGVQGSQGASGTQGAQGSQGSQGNQGSQGPQGNQGGTGPQGAQGAQGGAGVQGPQGSQGPQGAAGAFAGATAVSAKFGRATLPATPDQVGALSSKTLDGGTWTAYAQVDVSMQASGAIQCRLVRSSLRSVSSSLGGTFLTRISHPIGVSGVFHATGDAWSTINLQAVVTLSKASSNLAVQCFRTVPGGSKTFVDSGDIMAVSDPGAVSAAERPLNNRFRPSASRHRAAG